MESDLISKKALLETLWNPQEYADSLTCRLMIHRIASFPAVDAEPVHYGFIICGNKDGRSQRIFSCCNTDFTNLTAWMIPNYCPNCGAKILAEGDSSNE